MSFLHVAVVDLWVSRGVAAVLADVDLVSAFLVGVLEADVVDLATVRLEGAALGEGLLAVEARVWTNA